MKLVDIINILENREQMVKTYVKTNVFSNKDVQLIDSITHGDPYTKLVADAVYYLGNRFSKMVEPRELNDHDISILQTFHKNLKAYDKNVFPLTDLFALEKQSHPLDSLNRLNLRNRIIEIIKTFPPILLRNVKPDIRKERNQYDFENLFTDLKSIRDSMKLVERLNNENKAKLYKKIFSSKFTTFTEIKDRLEHIRIPYLSEDNPIDYLLEKIEDMGDEAELIYNQNNILVVVIKSYSAMSYIGCSAQWCFVTQFDQWDNYSPEGYATIVFNLNEDPWENTRMVVVLSYGEVYDMYNELIEDGDIYLDNIGVGNIVNSFEYEAEAIMKKNEKYDKQLSLFEIYKI